MPNVKKIFDTVMGATKTGLKATGKAARYMGSKATPGNVTELVTNIPMNKAFYKEHPGMAALFATGGAAFTASMGRDIYKSAKESSQWEKRMKEEYRYEQNLYLTQRVEEEKQRRLQRDMVENAARLAAAAPDVYNRVLAGRRLPRGAVVLGGAPRTDLLEELAYRMASGGYKPEQPTDLLEELQAFQ